MENLDLPAYFKVIGIFIVMLVYFMAVWHFYFPFGIHMLWPFGILLKIWSNLWSFYMYVPFWYILRPFGISIAFTVYFYSVCFLVRCGKKNLTTLLNPHHLTPRSLVHFFQSSKPAFCP
jgi:hypothetical protein